MGQNGSPRWYGSWYLHVLPTVRSETCFVDLSRVQQQRHAHLDGRIPFYDVEKRVRTKSGEWRWIQNRAKVVEWDEHGKAVRMVGAQTDITDRKSFEIALEEKNRQLDLALHQAAAAAQSKSEFLANIT